ncbi:GATOR complex protein MIOS-A-like isoform X2 [Amphibalanus amphitrite]|uniref:GATOR complex protein MIOS-A-like isoform X2 n=1 Tax=Amphibalanus amphitrite TaxID=1232801 RepID=UPI001C90067D|nr:GATOR complex protein MIOS-A-like isoform X2 [Amphibalanus amphitrite]XP_043215585.1 GATOR complex protein MIOS-A-like isoform X2 [Amphibalanus amphitrite]XP_043215586.1 GATOR complex protein MIOS-A-like isoform X2 [Amphibalanus amphitrite]XP_043215587.1 GATOR complex protein MIOS-A-like isoform X2 [Amphibalanus amphitrite]
MRVQWIPHKEDMFLSWGNEISLHRVDADKSHPVADGSHCCRKVELVATYSELKYIRCLATCPYSSSPMLLAVGLTSGAVSLAAISQNYMDLNVLNNFVPKHERQCNAVAWERNGSNLLAVGLDKHRNDSSIFVWDATGAPGQLSSSRLGMEPAKPYLEIGNSESTSSLAWFKQPKVLVAGMNNRTLKVFDLRVRATDRTGLARYPVKPQMSAATRLVYGLCVDPYLDDRLATFAENQVAIWDRRNFEKPVITLTDARTKAIFGIGWSPTRQDLLSSLGKDSGLLKLHDINHYCVNNDEIEPTVAERYVEGCGGIGPLADLSWHPTDENRIVVSSASGKLSDFTIFERITMNWSPGFSFIWSNGGRRLNLVSDESDTYDQLEDISVVMRDRALKGYGVTDRLSDNAALAGDDRLKNVWLWMAYSQQLQARAAEEGSAAAGAGAFQGVRSVLAGDGSTPVKSTIELRSWIGVERVAKCKVFRSASRDRALQLCGWATDELAQNTLLDALEKEGNHARAAAVAVFQLTLRRAIQILRRSQDPQLKVVAMALSGFTNEKKALWHEISAELRPSLTDPYIRAIFSFLTAEADDYDGVLKEYDITVHDRVAFACRFLPDDKLHSCLNHITQTLKNEANLQAILLTGVADEGLELLQNYINVSGDVQTAALIASYAGQAAERRVSVWIDSYRSLLDLWRLWNQRARFDVRVLSQTAGVQQYPKQSVVTCNFCNKSVSAYIDDMRRRRQMARTGANSVKPMCCPHCRKALPRCALCMIQLGTPASSWGAAGQGSADFDSWFTWCQTCRHGGHAAHMGAWFEEYAECPVTGCPCKCMSLDSVSRVLPVTNS